MILAPGTAKILETIHFWFMGFLSNS